MLRWLGPNKAQVYSNIHPHIRTLQNGEITDDPLAAIGSTSSDPNRIYSVSRINPLFLDSLTSSDGQAEEPQNAKKSETKSSKNAEKSSSSGYAGSFESSSHSPAYSDRLQLQEVAVAILEQNPGKAPRNSASGSSSSGTLNTIPEGKLDLTIPRPIWPYEDEKRDKRRKEYYDSLVDETLLLYTSFSYRPEGKDCVNDRLISVKDILVDLLNGINATIEGTTGLSPEDMLKRVNDRIAMSIEALKMSTEEEVKNLCINLSNCRKINSVLRAFSNSNSSSGNSSQSSPEFRSRSQSTDPEEIYHIPSGSSSSGFSDSVKNVTNVNANSSPGFTYEDLSGVRNSIRNAMVYGTLCRGCKSTLTGKSGEVPKKSLLKSGDEKPSVWEQYYGIGSEPGGEVKFAVKPTDVPLFPGGRPEADFTLDVPRSELLSKRMKADKQWRCRCRLLTSFLGLVFFLLSVMAVSLVLTKGKRMFGSMV